MIIMMRNRVSLREAVELWIKSSVEEDSDIHVGGNACDFDFNATVYGEQNNKLLDNEDEDCKFEEEQREWFWRNWNCK